MRCNANAQSQRRSARAYMQPFYESEEINATLISSSRSSSAGKKRCPFFPLDFKLKREVSVVVDLPQSWRQSHDDLTAGCAMNFSRFSDIKNAPVSWGPPPQNFAGNCGF